MKHTEDKELRGHALVFDGPLDLVQEARKAQEKLEIKKNEIKKLIEKKEKEIEAWIKGGKVGSMPKFPNYYSMMPNAVVSPYNNYTGRKSETWAEVEGFLRKPWPEAVEMIDDVVDEINKAGLPTPKSLKRKKKWSEDQGEVDTDRVMKGEPEYLESMKRELSTGPTSVSLLCNLDTFAGSNKIGVYWRSASAIAVADILEERGYMTELWFWCRGFSVYPPPNSNQFNACCLKQAGDPLDKDAICDGLSAWFTICGIFGSFAANPVVAPKSIGGAQGELGPWIKYLEPTGAHVIPVKITYTRKESVDEARRILEQVIARQEGRETEDDLKDY